MNKNFISIVSILAVLVFSSSCKKEEVDPKGGQESSGIFTARLNGQLWTAGKIDKIKNTPTGGSPSTQFNAYNDSDASVMVFTFEPDAEQKEYVVGTDISFAISYYQNVKKSSTLEYSNHGKITITKYSADSLVATFNFDTDNYTATNGKIKIKHN